MTVSELIELLQEIDQDSEVYLGYEQVDCTTVYMHGRDCIISDEPDDDQE